MSEDHSLRMWVVYWNPSDYPGRYVVRAQVVDNQGTRAEPSPLAVVSTLEEAREAIPGRSFNLGRYAEDDPVIVEVWV